MDTHSPPRRKGRYIHSGQAVVVQRATSGRFQPTHSRQNALIATRGDALPRVAFRYVARQLLGICPAREATADCRAGSVGVRGFCARESSPSAALARQGSRPMGRHLQAGPHWPSQVQPWFRSGRPGGRPSATNSEASSPRRPRSAFRPVARGPGPRRRYARRWRALLQTLRIHSGALPRLVTGGLRCPSIPPISTASLRTNSGGNLSGGRLRTAQRESPDGRGLSSSKKSCRNF